jgi:hypothetical protein
VPNEGVENIDGYEVYVEIERTRGVCLTMIALPFTLKGYLKASGPLAFEATKVA